ncbi:MAG: sigma-70 family RNA polymerase sigma factor [Armatimonas sp.]
MLTPLRTRRWPWSVQQTNSKEAMGAALIARYSARLYQYARRQTGSDHDAEDIVSETLAAAISAGKAPPAVESADDPTRAYLFGIARRKIALHLRQKSRRPVEALTDTLVSHLPTPEREALDSERRQSVRTLLDSLPAEWREVLLLKYVEQLSIGEIALILNRSDAAVNSLLQRARAAARERGGALFYDSEDNFHAR